MKTRFVRSAAIAGVASAAILFSSMTASATVISATLSIDFSGTKAATVDPVVTFDDMGGTGTVRLTVDINAAPIANKLSDLWFNFNGDATTLAFNNEVGPATTATTPATCNNCNTGPFTSFKPDGDGFFDVHLAWPTSDADAFKGGAGAADPDGGGPNLAPGIYQIDIILAGITAGDFNLLSIDPASGTPNSHHCVAAHLQGLGGDGSDFLGNGGLCTELTGGGGGGTVPEPRTLALFGLGLAGLGFARRRKAA